MVRLANRRGPREPRFTRRGWMLVAGGWWFCPFAALRGMERREWGGGKQEGAQQEDRGGYAGQADAFRAWVRMAIL